MTTITIPEIAPSLIIWRSLVLTRDGYICQNCLNGNVRDLKAHHIIPINKDESLKFTVSNGITLCDNCHKLAHTRKKHINFLIPSPHIKTLSEKRAEAGRLGGIASNKLHLRSKEYLSSISKGHGRPRRLSYDEVVNGGNGK